ncbi:MAG: polysaccharide lyase family 7 protein [Verrucomicrobiota bacterium JB025]|nr:polysaccharide lyase family 7 protein [Verrucomicrobiota bacterium JB025]
MKPLLAGLLLWTSLPAEAADKKNTQPGPAEDAHSVSTKVLPSDVLPSLPDWKITLPVDAKGKDSSAAAEVDKRNRKPREVIDDALTGFEMPPYFYARGGEVFFRAHCGGATTKGSKYPRCELRQRVGGGNGYWSMQDHQKLVTELRVTKTPVQKPEVCMVQIHGPDDEPMRLQYHARTGLHLIWNESHKKKFSNEVPYTLGQRLRVTTEVDKGRITCTVLNLDNQKQFTHTWTAVDKAGYFKLGCYTQSSIFLSQFKNGMKDEESDAYGEVAVSKIELTETFRK